MKLNFSIIATLFRTEMRMVLRDRRMVITSILLPLLLTPLMFLGSNWSIKKRERTLREMEYHYALAGSEAAAVRELLAATHQRLDKTNSAPASKDRFRFTETACTNALAALNQGTVQLVLEGLTAEEASRTNAPPAPKKSGVTAGGGAPEDDFGSEKPVAGAPVVRILFRADRDESSAAMDRLRHALEDTRLEQRHTALRGHGFPIEPRAVAAIAEVDLASKARLAGLGLGRVVTLGLLLLVLMGGSVVATDSLAGEKERGTLETLLTTSAGRVEILAAKLLVILAVAMLITSIQAANLLAYAGLKLLPVPAHLLAVLSPGNIALLFLLFLPVAALTAAVLLVVSGYARSYKEAQLYFFPVFLLGLVPALAPLLPGVELRSAIVLVPIANLAVATREAFTGNYDWPMMVLAWVVTTAAAAWTARLGVRALASEKLVTAAEMDAVDAAGGAALFERHVPRWFVSLWAVLLIVNNYLERTDVRVQLLINVVVLFFGASCLMMWRYRLNPREALALRLPRPAVWVGVIAAVPGGLLTAVGLFRLVSLVLPVPVKVMESFEQGILPPNVPMLELLFFLTVVPSVFEEIAFRGMLLHGLRRRLHPVTLAIVVGLTFGVFHVALFRLVPTACLGAMLAAVTMLTGSIFPAMLWHCLSNATGIWAAQQQIPETDLDSACYLMGAGLLAAAFWIFWRNRTPYPGLRPWRTPGKSLS